MAKNVTCEVLSTVKGLDPRSPREYTHAGTADNPTLISLPDNAATAGLVASGALRIYPGQQAEPQLPENEKLKALQMKLAGLEKSLLDAGAVAEKAADALRNVAAATDIETAVKIATEALV